MAKFLVQAVSRQGYDGIWRAGHKWPSSAPAEVEVLDVDEDPQRDPKKGIVLGKKSWASIMEDGQLTKAPAGDPLAILKQSSDIEALRREVERLTAENAALRGGQPAESPSTRKGGKHAE